jgi:hypothetical protein
MTSSAPFVTKVCLLAPPHPSRSAAIAPCSCTPAAPWGRLCSLCTECIPNIGRSIMNVLLQCDAVQPGAASRTFRKSILSAKQLAVPCLVQSSIGSTEAVNSCEIWMSCTRLHGITCQKMPMHLRTLDSARPVGRGKEPTSAL